MRIKHFKTLWEFCYPHSKILITGRPNFFFDEQEMIASLGIVESTPGKPYCQAIRLMPFNLDQIKDALRKHDEVVREEICLFATENEQFRELVSRPSLLHIVSVLWKKEHLSRHLEEISSAYVMRLFVQHSYLRQGLKERDSSDFMALTMEERRYFMKGIATYMATRELPNQIRGDQLNEVIVSLTNAIPEVVSTRSSAITGESRNPLKSRVEKSEHGIEHIQTDVRTCGILVDDPVAPGTFRFGHKSFMEYLFAEVIADQIKDDGTPDASSILNACVASARDIAHLPVSIKFLSELLGTNITYNQQTIDNQRALAKKILRLLLGGTALNYYFGRIDLYHLTILQSSKDWPAILRFILVPIFGTFFFPVLAATCVSAALATIIFTILADGKLFKIFNLELLDAVFVANIIFMILATYLVYQKRFRKHGNTSSGTEHDSLGSQGAIFVWNRLCKELGFSDRVLFEIAGIGWIPWTKNQSFDFFLSEGEEN